MTLTPDWLGEGLGAKPDITRNRSGRSHGVYFTQREAISAAMRASAFRERDASVPGRVEAAFLTQTANDQNFADCTGAWLPEKPFPLRHVGGAIWRTSGSNPLAPGGFLGVKGSAGLRNTLDDYAPLHRSSQSGEALLDAFVKTCQRWHLSAEQQVILLGYKGSEFVGRRFLEGRFIALSQDGKDRTGYVLSISIGLGSLFDESEEAELAWLTVAREAFGGKSALDFMLEGHLANLMVVADLVAYERGL
jgi:hypothetical protein